jgi:putative endonuclease
MHPAARRRTELAREGEDAAARHLESAGYRIVGRNVRVGDDEADIVAIAPSGAVAVVEVKARRGGWRPEERVDAVKRSRLVRLAEALAARPAFRGCLFQFDVVAVARGGPGAEVLHWPHAFDAGRRG